MYIGFLSRDERMKVAAALAAREGHKTVIADRLESALPVISEADLIVLPIPVSRDGLFLCATDIPLSAICPKRGARLFGGGIPAALTERLAAHPMLDALTDEGFNQQNARLTAEGGIRIALGATGRGFYGIGATLFGFGRIARQSARLLHGFGVPVTVIARRKEVLAEASASGYRVRPLSYPLYTEDALIIGTVPASIYEGVCVGEGATVIDLGGGMPSHLPCPSGTVEVISARGVPGVFAPRAAGEIVYASLSVLLEDPP